MIATLGRHAAPQEAPRRFMPLIGVAVAVAVAAVQVIASQAMGGLTPIFG